MTYCSSLKIVIIYNFSEIERTFSVLFEDYVADCWWFRGMVSICLIGKDQYDWFLYEYEGLFLDWLIFLLHLLQSVCCSKYSAKTTHFSILNPFFHFLHPLVLKHFRIFIAVPNAIYVSLPSKDFHEGNLEENFICFVVFCLHGLVCWRLIVSE